MADQRDGKLMPDDDAPGPEDSGRGRQRWEIITLATMYVGYAAFMLCRNTLITASATMISQGFLDKVNYGRLMT